jgi:putative ABC transport system permease protein
MMRILRALLDALNREKLSGELREELRFHQAQLARDARADGLNNGDANDAARRRLGNATAILEEARSMWTIQWFDHLAQDVRYAFRSLRKNPSFTIVAVATLALGIGATTAIFTVVNSVVLRPLPYKDPERLVLMWERMPDAPQIMFSYQNFQDWHGNVRAFEDAAVYNPYGQFTLTNMGNAERVRGGLGTGNVFDVFGVTAAKGRLFRKEDDHVGAAPVAVITNGYWTRKFGRDSTIIGKTLTLDGVSYTIVGVLPPNVQPGSVDVWMPLGLFANSDRFNTRANHPGLVGIGRLREGVTLAQMQTGLDDAYAKLRADYPENAGISASGMWLPEYVTGDVKGPLYMLAGAVALVLLIACANVANLMLGRAASRSREIALRMAIGARRSRIVRQLLTESAVLSIAGGVLGIAVAWAGVRGFLSLNPTGVPRLHEVGIDVRVLLFALVVSMLTGVLFGLVPALQTIRHDLTKSLRDGSRGSTEGKRPLRLRSALMLAEVSLALVLLVGAGLLARTFQKLTSVDTGVDPSGVVVGLVSLPDKKYPDVERRRQMFTELLERVRAIPGVSDAAFGGDLPTSNSWQSGFTFTGLPPVAAGKEPLLPAMLATPDWFRTMRMRVVAGRTFEASDAAGTTPVIIISEAIARRYFANINPIGQRARRPGAAGSPDLTIVGVVNDVANEGPRVRSRGTIYFPLAQETTGARNLWIAARTTASTATTLAAVRGALADVDREIPLANARTLEESIAGSVSQPRFSMLMFSAFAAIALALAAIGIYGVISYAVALRTHEIGVRVALGARRLDVIGMVVRQVFVIAGIGIVVGVGASLAAGRALSGLLFSVAPSDPLTIAFSCLVLGGVALLAAAVPAWRASRMDPITALRAD